jgi:hypothetical protein
LPLENTPLHESPPNRLGGKTLVVDREKVGCFNLPSEAIAKAEEHDQIVIRPGIYEDRVVITDRQIYLLGAGRDHVTIFSRRSGPCYLQRVSGGQITGLTFRYVGSDQHSALIVGRQRAYYPASSSTALIAGRPYWKTKFVITGNPAYLLLQVLSLTCEKISALATIILALQPETKELGPTSSKTSVETIC